MTKIKGQGTLTKFITSKIAERNKDLFNKLIYDSKEIERLITKLDNNKTIDLQVVSFSSLRDFSEQFYSVLSFVRFIGKPFSWIVYSDGTHTKEQINSIELSFPFLKVINNAVDESFINGNIKNSLKNYRKEFIHYAKTAALGRRLFLYLNFEIKKPTLFIDSDVLFYQKSSCIEQLLSENTNGWFMAEPGWATLDSRYMKNRSPQHYQVNGGFFLFNKELEFVEGGLNFLKSLEATYEYFSDQNVFHIMLLENKFMPLDPRNFILNSGDQFDFSYLASPNKMAVRHYTGPVRHKMWQRDWKWHLQLL